MYTAKYTEVLINLMENEQTKPLLDKAMSTYPMYKPTNEFTYFIIPTREELNKKILDFYAFREIGTETVGRFLRELEVSLNEIMPYYFQYYKSADIMNGIDDPFGNVDIVEKFEQETTGSSSGTSKTDTSSSTDTNSSSESTNNMTNKGKTVNVDTPQGSDGALSKGADEIDTLTHASNVNFNKDSSESFGTTSDEGTSSSESSSEGTSSSESSGTTKHTFTKQGNQGVNTYAHDMKELREVFMNIEQRIINDPRISELFLQIY